MAYNKRTVSFFRLILEKQIDGHKETLTKKQTEECFQKIYNTRMVSLESGNKAANVTTNGNAYGGEIMPVTMIFQNRMMGAVMDRFGRDIFVTKEDDRHFRVTVNVAVSNQFFGWVFGLGKMVRIVGPESVKEKMKKALEGILERYE